jgi:hypothetical protein
MPRRPPVLAYVTPSHQFPLGPTLALDQLIMAEFINSGEFDKHLRRIRIVYMARRDCLMEERPTDHAMTGHEGGMHLAWHLPHHCPMHLRCSNWPPQEPSLRRGHAALRLHQTARCGLPWCRKPRSGWPCRTAALISMPKHRSVR